MSETGITGRLSDLVAKRATERAESAKAEEAQAQRDYRAALALMAEGRDAEVDADRLEELLARWGYSPADLEGHLAEKCRRNRLLAAVRAGERADEFDTVARDAGRAARSDLAATRPLFWSDARWRAASDACYRATERLRAAKLRAAAAGGDAPGRIEWHREAVRRLRLAISAWEGGRGHTAEVRGTAGIVPGFVNFDLDVVEARRYLAKYEAEAAEAERDLADAGRVGALEAELDQARAELRAAEEERYTW